MSRIRHWIAVGLSFFLLALTPLDSSAEQISIQGQACPEVDASIVRDSERLRCTLMSGKLLWQIDTSSKIKEIWNSLEKIRGNQSSEMASMTAVYSPKVNQALAKRLLSSLDSAAKFWQDYRLGADSIPILFFTENDEKWYVRQLKVIGLDGTAIKNKRESLRDEIRRNGSLANMAGMNGFHGKSWMEFMIGTKQKSLDLSALKVGPHEWTHYAQYSMVGMENLEYVPCWLMEGSAEFYGMLLSAGNKSHLNSLRKLQLTERYPRNFAGMRFEVQQGWERFLEENGPQVSNPRYNQDCGINGSYTVGAAATEYLFVLQGHQGIVNFMEQIGVLRDYKKAFEYVYGIDWASGKRQIANYIRSIVAQVDLT